MADDDGVVHTLTVDEIKRREEILLMAYCAENHIVRENIDAVELGKFLELPAVRELLELKYPQRRR